MFHVEVIVSKLYSITRHHEHFAYYVTPLCTSYPPSAMHSQ